MEISWDWYQCTLPADTSLVEFRLDLAIMLGEPQIKKGLHGYDFCEDYTHLKIQTGGSSGIWGPHIIVHGGDLTDRLVWHVRKYFPEHRVSRFDVALDFSCDGAFEWASDLGFAVIDEFGLDCEQRGDWHNLIKGRTLYVGSRKSTHYCRIYEKGIQMRLNGFSPSASPNWVRVEFEVKPSRQSRLLASKMEPLDVIHSSRWSTMLSNLLGSVGMRSVSLSTRRQKSEVVQSLEHMFYQYSSLLKKAVDEQLISESDLVDAVRLCVREGNFLEFPPHVFRDWYFDPASTKDKGGHLISARVWQESKS